MLEERVDVCQTCLSKKAPQLPLREEILSQGFETVLMKSPGQKDWNNHQVNKKRNKKENRLKKEDRTDVNDTEWARIVKRRQKRWKNAVTYEKYNNPDEGSLVSACTDKEDSDDQTMSTSNTVSLSNSQSYDSIFAEDSQNRDAPIVTKSTDQIKKRDSFGMNKLSNNEEIESSGLTANRELQNDNIFHALTVNSHVHTSLTSQRKVTKTKDPNEEFSDKSISNECRDTQPVCETKNREQANLQRNRVKWYPDNYTNPGERDVDDFNEIMDYEPVMNRNINDVEQQNANTNCATTMLTIFDEACFGILSNNAHVGNEDDAQYTRNLQLLREQSNLDTGQVNERRMYGTPEARHRHVVAICGKAFNSPTELSIALEQDPLMAKVVDRDGKLPLHAVCTAGMQIQTLPDHLFRSRSIKSKKNSFSEDGNKDEGVLSYNNSKDVQDALQSGMSNQDSLYSALMNIKENAECLKDIISIVLRANEEAALMVDRNGDLPIHLLTRQLWSWEKHFKDNYLHRKDNQNDNLQVFISRKHVKQLKALFKEVNFIHRECIQSLLQPIRRTRSVCRAKGSKGVLLPLHIATLHGVKINILKDLIALYDEAVSVKCDGALKGLKPILPIDLLDRHKPKQKQARLSKSYSTDKTEETIHSQGSLVVFNQASDLIFMHYPNVTSHRKDTNRLNRIEAHVRSIALDPEVPLLPSAVRHFWIWLNTFNTEDNYETSDESNDCEIRDCAVSVKNIIDGLDMKSLTKLLALQENESDPVDILNIATRSCLEVLSSYRDELIAKQTNSTESNQKSALKKGKYSPTNGEEKNRKERTGPLVAQICRLIFGITSEEDYVPISFIILPYKLQPNREGGLELVNKEDADVALRFAESLLNINNSGAIVHTLNRRLLDNGFGKSIEQNKTWCELEEKVRQSKQSLLSTYDGVKGYLYFLDEYRGVPVVFRADSDLYNGIYPFEIDNPAEVVEQILPLMQMGMVLMRGDCGLNDLAQIIVRNAKIILPEQKLNELLAVVDNLQGGHSENNSRSARDDLLKFAVMFYSDSISEEDMECSTTLGWNKEVSLLEELYEKFDKKRLYAGLLPIKNSYDSNLWTYIKENEKCDSDKDCEESETKSFSEISDGANHTSDGSEEHICIQDSSVEQCVTVNDEDYRISFEHKMEDVLEENAMHVNDNNSQVYPDESTLDFDANTYSSAFEQLYSSAASQKDSLVISESSNGKSIQKLEFPTKDCNTEENAKDSFELSPGKKRKNLPGKSVLYDSFNELPNDVNVWNKIDFDENSTITGVTDYSKNGIDAISQNGADEVSIWSMETPDEDESLARQRNPLDGDNNLAKNMEDSCHQSNIHTLGGLPCVKEQPTFELEENSLSEDHSDSFMGVISDGSRGDNALMNQPSLENKSSIQSVSFDNCKEFTKACTKQLEDCEKFKYKSLKENKSDKSLSIKEDLLSDKEKQIEELKLAITAFDEEEKNLLKEKEQLILFLERQLNVNFENTENITEFSLDNLNNKDDQELSLKNKTSWTNEKESINDEVQSKLMGRVYELEEVLMQKDKQIDYLESSMRERLSTLHVGHDVKIAELLTGLSEKEEELKYYEQALEQFVTKY